MSRWLYLWLLGCLLVSCGNIARAQGSRKTAAKPPAAEQTSAKVDLAIHRLILKDGSYQVVSEYQVKGDRVRYISAERGGDWEEIPMTLIDWPATQKYAKEHSGDSPFAHDNDPPQDAAAIDAEEKAERNRFPEVVPNLRLPDQTGIWALDYYHDSPELVDLEQSSGNVNDRTGHNLLRSALNPAGMTRQTIEIDGRHAKPGLHEALPLFFVSVDQETDEPGADALTVDTHGATAGKKTPSGSAATSQYVIVRAAVKKDFRVVGGVKVDAAGQPTGDVIRTRAEMLPGRHWMKLTPLEPMAAGDYVLMELLSPHEANLSVWDFRIDQGASDNANAILPLQRSSLTR